MKKKLVKDIAYSDDFHCIDSHVRHVGKSFKTVYSVDVKYKVRSGGKYHVKTYTSDYGNYRLASLRFDTENSSRTNPSYMEISKVVLRSTTYLDGKSVGKDILRKISYDSPMLFDDDGNNLFVNMVGHEDEI